jgi:hypothetical protein
MESGSPETNGDMAIDGHQEGTGQRTKRKVRRLSYSPRLDPSLRSLMCADICRTPLARFK